MVKARVSQPQGCESGRAGAALCRLQPLGELILPLTGQHSGTGPGGMGVSVPARGHESRRAGKLTLLPANGDVGIGWPN